MWGWVDGDGDECATDDQRRPPCLPARRRVERGTLPARLGLRVVRYGVESVGEADALTLSRFAPPVLASLELVRLIVHPLLRDGAAAGARWPKMRGMQASVIPLASGAVAVSSRLMRGATGLTKARAHAFCNAIASNYNHSRDSRHHAEGLIWRLVKNSTLILAARWSVLRRADFHFTKCCTYLPPTGPWLGQLRASVPTRKVSGPQRSWLCRRGLMVIMALHGVVK